MSDNIAAPATQTPAPVAQVLATHATGPLLTWIHSLEARAVRAEQALADLEKRVAASLKNAGHELKAKL
jgi:hypothetical protein